MFPATRMDIRVGIIQYGLWPSPEVFVNFFTKRVKLILFKVKKIMSVKKCKIESLSGMELVSRKMKVASIPLAILMAIAVP
jgi:alanine racemase